MHSLVVLYLQTLILAGSAEAQNVSFIARRDFGTGTIGPVSVAVGDFNGDGVQDMAVANEGSDEFFLNGSVSVFLGNGDGTFQAAVNFRAGTGPASVAVGDFNGDGVQDLAVANEGPFSNNVSVLLGNGDGTFQRAVDYSTGTTPLSVAVGDFNGDGVQDLAVTNAGSNNVSVLLGNGDGTFQAAVNYNTGAWSQSVAVGDFNADGVQDLAVANVDSNNVSVLLGNGDGTFQAAVNFRAGTGPVSVAVGDFNGDGVQDLAVANEGSFPNFTDSSVSVLLGNGNGTFQAAVNYSTGAGSFSVTVGDFNGDGVQDLAVANVDSNNVSVLLGNGDGTFQAAVNYRTGIGSQVVDGKIGVTRSVTVGDFNSDGVQDLAVTNGGSDNVSVFIGNGDGTFQSAVNFGAGTNTLSVAGGDFNGDGVQDLAVANEGSFPNFTDSSVSVLLGNGNGTFQAPVNYSTGAESTGVAVGDFNGDGVQDLAVANLGTPPSFTDGNVSVLLGNEDGTFQAAVNYSTGAKPTAVAVGDFNGDGVQDLAVANEGSGSNNVSVLLGRGDGTFQSAVNFGAGRTPVFVAVGDFNGDGVQDLAVTNAGSNDVSVLLGNGDGTFQAAVNYSTGAWSQSVAVGDFNGDGVQDLAVANVHSNNVSVLLGNGDGTFQAAVNYRTEGFEGSWSVAVGDFNDDGVQDLAVGNGGDVSVLLGNRDGTFQSAVNFGAGTASVAVGDFNGDGVQDLAVANGGGVSVLINNTLSHR
jgi:hypothetical protein